MTTEARTGEEIVLPLAAETLVVTKRTVERDTVTVATRTSTREETVALELQSTRVEIERVPINRFVDTMPVPRTEGDSIVVPVVEEVVVTRLFLKEEVRLVPVRSTRPHAETITLRTQQAVISRSERSGPGSASLTENITQEGQRDAE